MTAPKFAEIMSAVSREFGVPEAEILGRSRPHYVVVPRQSVMYMCSIAGYPMTYAARRMGRHHTTISDGVTATKHRMLTDLGLKRRVDRLCVTLLPKR